MNRRFFVAFSSIFLVAVASASGDGSGLLPNPDFDEPEGKSGVLGWRELSPLFSEMNVISDDADDCTFSGAADAINTIDDTDAGTTTFVGCTNEVVSGQAYRATGSIRFPVGTDPSEFAGQLNFYDESNCFGEFVGTGSATNAEYESETTTEWTPFALGPVTAPPEALSIGVRIHLMKDLATDNVSDLYFDKIYLTPADFVFSEDFETGFACRWSQEVGLEP